MTQPTRYNPAPSPSVYMRGTIGGFLIFIGACLMFYNLFVFNTSSTPNPYSPVPQFERSDNFGKATDKQCGCIVGGFIALMGTVLVASIPPRP